MLRSHLAERRLAHIHHRPPATVLLGDLPQLTHHALPPPAARPASPAEPRPRAAARRRQRLPHRRRHDRLARSPAPTARTSTTSVSAGGSTPPRTALPQPAPAARPATATPAGDPTTPSDALRPARHGRSVHRAGIVPALPSTSRQISAVSPASVRHPAPQARHHAARPARPPAAPAPAKHPQHE